MKTLVIIIGAAMLAVGCSHKPDAREVARDAKIAQLEARVVDLETRHEQLKSSFTNFLDVVQRANTDNTEALTKIETLVKNDEQNWDSFVGLIAALTNTPPKQAAAPRSYYPVQPQPSAYATKDGVPIAIYNQIAAGAANKWPGNYEMQDYEINNQVEAYRKLHQ
jgi:outer membrane murein-binding lipoprotein Lpp